MQIGVLLVGAVLAAVGVAHPGHDVAQEAAERREILLQTRNDLSHCAEKLKARGVHHRNIQRRSKIAEGLMSEQGLQARQLSKLLNVPHKSSKKYDANTAPATIFAGNASCVLSPEVTEGPYYVAGEKIRPNVVDGQKGLPMTIDVQVIDVATCNPVPAAYVEIWNCNSTGVYGGVVAGGNGVGTADPTNINNTMLRGVQVTDKDGAVQFATLFPGHYIGRTTHVHVMVHLNAKAQPNGTLIDTTAAHVGQMYFDQDLITEVEKLEPYIQNKQVLTTNAQDFILAQEAETTDPFMEYVHLGDNLQDGLFAWLSFGINTTLQRTVSAATTLYETGGKANPNPGMGMPPGGFPPGGFPPGGFPPGGFPPGGPPGGPPGRPGMPGSPGVPPSSPTPVPP